MAKKKKISRKKLLKEPDEFITISGKMLTFITEKKVRLYWAGGSLFIIVLLILGFQFFTGIAENKAFDMLDRLISSYNDLAKEKGPEKAYLDVEKDFQTLLDKYGSRKGGKYGRLIYGDICYNAGQYDKAIALYQQASRDFKHVYPYENIILKSLGYSYEEKKDFSSAMTYFEKILSQPDPLMKDEVLFALARTYSEMGQRGKSIDTYRQILTNYPDSMFSQVAKNNVGG